MDDLIRLLDLALELRARTIGGSQRIELLRGELRFVPVVVSPGFSLQFFGSAAATESRRFGNVSVSAAAPAGLPMSSALKRTTSGAVQRLLALT
jgi:hypothetical protein